MGRAKVESTVRTFRIRNTILVRLENYSEQTMVPMTAVINKALEEYLNKNERK